MKYIKPLSSILILMTGVQVLNSMEEKARQPQPRTYLETLPYELRNRIEAISNIYNQMDEAIEKGAEAKARALFEKYGPTVFSSETISRAITKYATAHPDKHNPIAEIILILTDSGIDIIKKDAQGQTLLLKLLKAKIQGLVILSSFFEKLKAMPEQERKDYINAQDAQGKTALMYAQKEDRVDLVNELLQLGGDVNLKDNEGKTVLHHAIGELYSIKMLKNILELLLARPEIKINETDNDGKTALIVAVLRGKLERVKLLLEHGANPNIRDNKGNSALHYAKKKKKIKQLLLEKSV